MVTLLTTLLLRSELYSCELPDGFLNFFSFNLLLSTVLLLLTIDSLYPVLILFLSLPRLCCSGGSLGTALFFFFHCKLILFSFSLLFLHFFIKLFSSLNTYCLWSTFCLTGISDSLLQPYFLKIWSACFRRIL